MYRDLELVYGGLILGMSQFFVNDWGAQKVLFVLEWSKVTQNNHLTAFTKVQSKSLMHSVIVFGHSDILSEKFDVVLNMPNDTIPSQSCSSFLKSAYVSQNIFCVPSFILAMKWKRTNNLLFLSYLVTQSSCRKGQAQWHPTCSSRVTFLQRVSWLPWGNLDKQFKICA